MKMPAKMTMAKRKFAIGPAATIAARLNTGWKKKLSARSAGSIVSRRGASGTLAGILIAKELYIAAERNSGDLPACAMAIIEADELRAETDREHQNPHPAQPRDEEMSELMEEDDEAEDKKKRDDVTDDPSAKRIQMRQKI